jgi:hypothetical protein
VFEKTVVSYKKCVPSLPKDHSWPILVAHATMSICISNIYDDISQKSSKGWDEGEHSCTIVAYTPKKGAFPKKGAKSPL